MLIPGTGGEHMRFRISFIMLIILFLLYIPIQLPVHAEEIAPPQLESEAAILVELETGTILLEKNATKKLNPASLTKIATAIYAIENGNLEDMVIVSENAYQTIGSSVYLEIGEKISLKELLEGLLVNSGNDAGIAIAEHLSGSVKQFSEDLNAYLEKNIGVQNTHFENPHGLYHSNHYTTAEDLAMITRYAMKNKDFRKLFGMKKLKWDGEKWDTTLYTHHKLLRETPYPGVTGGKTGYIEEAGHTLATTAERENLDLLTVTLNTDLQMDSYQDTEELLDYGFDNFIRKGQHVTKQNKVVNFRKLANANVNELKLQEQKVTLKRRVQVSSPNHGQQVPLSLNSIPINQYDILVLITLLAYLLFKFYYHKSQKP
jgi:serine-type D-Ala-D-Ala carboxypeptidase (penicillin-binding protein 5/6)